MNHKRVERVIFEIGLGPSRRVAGVIKGAGSPRMRFYSEDPRAGQPAGPPGRGHNTTTAAGFGRRQLAIGGHARIGLGDCCLIILFEGIVFGDALEDRPLEWDQRRRALPHQAKGVALAIRGRFSRFTAFSGGDPGWAGDGGSPGIGRPREEEHQSTRGTSRTRRCCAPAAGTAPTPPAAAASTFRS
jgi:hypothetical protein